MSTVTVTEVVPQAITAIQNYQLLARANATQRGMNLAESVVLRLKPFNGPSTATSPASTSPAAAVQETEMEDLTRSTLFSPEKKHNLVAATVMAAPGSLVTQEMSDQIAFIRNKLMASPTKESTALIEAGEDSQLVFQRELLQFQTQCNNPVVNVLVEGVLTLKAQYAHEKDKHALMERLIGKQVKKLYEGLAEELFEVINKNPEMKARYQRLKFKEEHIELRDLLNQLEKKSNTKCIEQKSMTEGWICVSQKKGEKSHEIDLSIDEIKAELSLIESIAQKAGNNPQQCLIEIAKLRKHVGRQNIDWGNVAYNTLIFSLTTIKIVATITSYTAPLWPIIAVVLPYIYPKQFFALLNFLWNVVIPGIVHVKNLM